jgi:hypothetical protein
MANTRLQGAIDREIVVTQQRIDRLVADGWAIANHVQSTTNQSKAGVLQKEAVKAIALALFLTTSPTFLSLAAACPAIGQTECNDRTSSSVPGCDR